MTDSEILTEMKAEILALPNNEIKRFGIPMFTCIYEAERLVVRATADSTELASVNCTAKHIERLDKLVRCARVACSTLAEVDSEIKLLRKQWKEVDYPVALKLRKLLLASCQLAFHGDLLLEEKVAEIRKGDGILDTIEDLIKLSVLGPENEKQLAQFNLPIEPFRKAGELAAELSRKHAVIDGDQYVTNQNVVLRDKALTLMQIQVDSIRRCGRFVFREDPDRLMHYSSTYIRQRNAKRKNNSKEGSGL